MDRQILARVAGGEKNALAELYDRHADSMMAVAYRILGNRTDAEDLLHDVLLEVWKKAQSYDPRRGTVRTWLLLRTRSRAIDRVRSLGVARKHGLAPMPEDQAGYAPSVAESGNSVDHGRVHRAMACLSEAQRVVVELSYFGGLSCREIAARCEIPIGTAKSRLAAAIARLRAELIPEGSMAR